MVAAWWRRPCGHTHATQAYIHRTYICCKDGYSLRLFAHIGSISIAKGFLDLSSGYNPTAGSSLSVAYRHFDCSSSSPVPSHDTFRTISVLKTIKGEIGSLFGSISIYALLDGDCESGCGGWGVEILAGPCFNQFPVVTQPR